MVLAGLSGTSGCRKCVKNMISVSVEKLSQFKDEIEFMIQDHHNEVGENDTEVNISWEAYGGLEEKGQLTSALMREDGKIIGYSIFQVGIMLAYGILTAVNLHLFLVKSRRNIVNGLKLIADGDQLLTEMGVKKINYYVTTKNDFSRLLERLGYNMEQKVFSRSTES